MSRHLIFGSGLIGGYLAGSLGSQGFDVSLHGRAKSQHAMANGITISDFHGHKLELAAPEFIHLEQDRLAPFDVIWLTVKCTSIESSISDLAKLVGPNSTIICCQNGLGADAIVKAAFPDIKVLTALVGFNVAEDTAGHFHRSTDGKVVIEQNTLSMNIAKHANCDLLPVLCSEDIQAQQWAKLQLNLSNPVNALSDIPTKAMLEQRGFRTIIAGLMRELLDVAAAKGISIPKITAAPAHWIPRVLALPDWAFLRVGQKMVAVDPSARLSMWWDLSAGRTTEIAYLNQALVQQGESVGIECRLNQRITELIYEVESGQRKIGIDAAKLTQLVDR